MKNKTNKERMHLVIPDTQVSPAHDYSYLEAIGKYIVHKKPDVVVMLGDFADMASLSTWDKGKLSFEGRRVQKDIDATKKAMSLLLNPLYEYNTKQLQQGNDVYLPELHLTLGNHEGRITRAVQNTPELQGLLSIDDLGYKEFGWTVHDFLVPVVIDGIVYCHYLTSGVRGLPINTARQLLTKRHMSCIVGHQQGYQIATERAADGRTLTGIIAGSSYLHDEDYMGPQENKHWRGFLVLHGVQNGGIKSVQQVSTEFAVSKFKGI